MKGVRRLLGVVLVSGVLVACGTSGDSGTSEAGATESSTSGGGVSEADATAATLLDAGFGQQDQFVWVTALVRNDSDTVGQTVIVHFNALDASGNTIKSADQVEAFSRPGETLAVGTQMTVSQEEVAKVKANLLVEDSGAFSDEPFPTMPVSDMQVTKRQYGGWQAQFTLKNPTSEPVQNPRIGIVCFAGDTIIGGRSTYPALVPANGTTVVESDVMVSGKPERCEAYVGAPAARS